MSGNFSHDDTGTSEGYQMGVEQIAKIFGERMLLLTHRVMRFEVNKKQTLIIEADWAPGLQGRIWKALVVVGAGQNRN